MAYVWALNVEFWKIYWPEINALTAMLDIAFGYFTGLYQFSNGHYNISTKGSSILLEFDLIGSDGRDGLNRFTGEDRGDRSKESNA